MSWARLGRQVRAIRLRERLRQEDVARRAGLSRSVVSMLERGLASRVAVGNVDAVLSALGARLDPRLMWHGPELDRLIDAGHAALSASVKRRLERWGWHVRVEVSFNHFGDRGRMDLLAWHPATHVVLVVEIKTSLVDVQALLGSMDTKARIAPLLSATFGWGVERVVPAIVFLEDRTTRRRIELLAGLFDRYELRGQTAISWARRPERFDRQPTGVLWFRALPDARVVRISGQRVRIARSRRSV